MTRHHLTFILALAVTVCVSQGAQASVTNLVRNGGLEAADPQHPDWPQGFAPSRVDKVAGVASEGAPLIWEQTGHRGDRSLSIENRTEQELGYWTTSAQVKPDTLYTLGAYVRCARESGQPEILVSPAGKTFRDPGGHDFYVAPVTNWQYYTQTFRTVPGQDGLEIELVLYQRPQQKVWFDDLSLVETSSLPQMTGACPEAGAVAAGGVTELLCQPAQDPQRYVFEYARDPWFVREVTQVGPLDAPRCALAKPLAAGTWHWHVGVLDDEGLPHFADALSFLVPVGSSDFRRADTTPPAAFRPRPAPDSSMASGAVAISARLADACSGVDVSSVRLLVDGADVTRAATVTPDGVTYCPQSPQATGVHSVEVRVCDAAGNAGNPLRWRFGVDAPVPVAARFDDKGSLLVGGAPYFPVGLYSYCCNPGAGASAEKLMAVASDAGMNGQLVEDEGSQETLDRLLANGMKVLLQVRSGLAASTDAEKSREALVDKGALRWKAHPALLGYWADEPDSTDPACMALAHDTIKQADPDHPAVWCLCVPDKYKQNAASADAIMPDIYPVPSAPLDLIVRQLKQAAADAGGKPVWFIPQVFDWVITGGGKVSSPVDFRPTADEIRAMTYLGIVAGARGIFYWASDTAATNDIVWYPAQWDELLKIAGELRYLGDALTVPPVAAQVQVEASGDGLYSAEWLRGDKTILVTVNASAGPIEAKFGLPGPKTVRCLFENRYLASPTREFRDLFRAYEVHVYELG